jgi:RNA-binding protein
MTTLTTRQRQYLKGLAHPLTPVVRIGKAGASPSVVAETKKALESHELIKVRVDVDDGGERKALAERLAAESDAALVATIGKVAVLYREREEEPEIKLPR